MNERFLELSEQGKCVIATLNIFSKVRDNSL